MEIQGRVDLNENEAYLSEFISSVNARRCHIADSNSAGVGFDGAKIGAIKLAKRVLNPIGSIVSAAEAVDWADPSCDIRPRLFDKSTKEFRLIDSGSMITATRKLPEDKVDDSVNLVAVNGTKIKTYGIRTIQIKIGRKAYSMPAVICDISQDILGMDFLAKYRLGVEWDDFDQTELYITDKKAQIKEILQMVTVPKDTQRLHYLSTANSESSDSNPELKPPVRDGRKEFFELACMKELAKDQLKPDADTEVSLSKHPKKYADLIRKYPPLLKFRVTKEVPPHGVFHRIDTPEGVPPCKAKRRPMIANSEKVKEGKRVWDQMLADGVISRVCVCVCVCIF